MNPPTPIHSLTIVIPALKEAENLAKLLPQIRATLASLPIAYEILIVDETADEATLQVAAQNQARVLSPSTRGYGQALLAGFAAAQGEYIVTMDADLSHPPRFLLDLWEARQQAEIVIASRYVRNGRADMPFSRLLLSRVLNGFFSIGLGLKVRDLSSGYRLYRASALSTASIEGKDFNILQELLVSARARGCKVIEIPFSYEPREHGSSHARVLKFGLAYLKTFGRMWQIRYGR